MRLRLVTPKNRLVTAKITVGNVKKRLGYAQKVVGAVPFFVKLNPGHGVHFRPIINP